MVMCAYLHDFFPWRHVFVPVDLLSIAHSVLLLGLSFKVP